MSERLRASERGSANDRKKASILGLVVNGVASSCFVFGWRWSGKRILVSELREPEDAGVSEN